MRQPRTLSGCLVLGFVLLLGPFPDANPEPPSAPTPRPPSGAKPAPTTTTSTPTAEPGPVVPTTFEDLVTGLDVPWGLAFLPDGSALVSERDSALVRQVTASAQVTEAGTGPDVVADNESGLLGLAVPPGQSTVYAYLTAADDNRVVRMSFDGGALGEPEVVIDGIPKAGNHNGGRLAFGPDGMLYVSTGDAAQPDRAQDLESLGGKILPLSPDGTVPADNPFAGSPVFSYGHRNVQGLAFDQDGRLWASEFGQNTWDELNLIEAGGNYGWAGVEGVGKDEPFIQPGGQWSPHET